MNLVLIYLNTLKVNAGYKWVIWNSWLAFREHSMTVVAGVSET
jgi:hypothetical protein